MHENKQCKFNGYLPSRPFLFFFELPDEEDDLSLLFQRINMFSFQKFRLTREFNLCHRLERYENPF